MGIPMFIAQPGPKGAVTHFLLVVGFPMGIYPIPPVPLEWMTAEGADLLGFDGYTLGAAKTGLHEIPLFEPPGWDAPIMGQSQRAILIFQKDSQAGR
jgi:hypothetical protein